MATGPTLIENIQFAESLIRTGIIDSVVQNTDVFNANSNGALALTNEFNPGEEARYSFWTNIPEASRRDPSADTDLTAEKITQGAMESVMLNRYTYTRMKKEALRQAGQGNSLNDYVGFVGEKLGGIINRGQVNDLFHALVGAVGSDDLAVDHNGLMETDLLYDVMEDMEDAWDNVRAIIMHPRVFSHLAREQKDANVYNIGGLSIMNGTPVTMGLPVIKSASSALVDTDDSPINTVYKTFFVTENAAVLNVPTEGGFDVFFEREVGKQNLGYIAQTEWTNEVYVKGYKWDSTANPTDSNLSDSANWTKVVNQDNTAGRMIKTRGADPA